MTADRDPDRSGLLLVGQFIVLLAVAAVGWMLHSEHQQLLDALGKVAARPAAANKPAQRPQQPKVVENWRSLVRPWNPTLGPADAPVTIVEFSDFQCPYCARHFRQTHPQLLKAFGGKIRLVYKHMPLPFHEQAMPAAIAAQCAQREGKFWELHDRIFEHQRTLSEQKLLELGREIGLSKAWERCFRNQETRSEVEQDMQDAQQAGARGTPTFLINGRFVPGALPFSHFKNIIEDQL